MKKFTRFMLIAALCLALAGAAMTFIGVRKCIRFVERYKPAEAVEHHFDIDPCAFDALTLTAGTAKVRTFGKQQIKLPLLHILHSNICLRPIGYLS